MFLNRFGWLDRNLLLDLPGLILERALSGSCSVSVRLLKSGCKNIGEAARISSKIPNQYADKGIFDLLIIDR
jgi:hypothetical protein